jgi:PAS domain S-box-containing protein
LRRGFDGLRLSGNTLWLEKRDWFDFVEYERAKHNVIGKYRMLAMCCYFLDECGASELMDVVQNHHFALIRRHGQWELFESAGRKRAEETLQESERELAIRNRIAQIFLTSSDEDMYGQVLEIVLEAMQSKYGTFAYIDENGDRVVPSMTRGIWDKCEVLNKSIVFPRETWGDNLWARALIEKKAITSDGPFKVPDGHIPITRALAVPIIHQEEAIGNFMVGNKPTDYNEQDEALLKTIATHTAPILHAWLQRERQDRKRKEMSEALKRERDFTTAVLSVAGALVVVLDRAGRIVRFNRACENLTGYSFEEIEGRHFWDVFLIAEEIDSVKAVFDALRSGQFPSVHENYWLAKDGSRRVIAWSNTAILDRKGMVEHVIGTGIDITERRKVEESLRQSAHLNQLVLDTLPHPAMLITRDRKVLATNRTAREAGTKVGEYCWRSFGRGEFIPENDKQYVKKHKGRTPPGGIKCTFCLADEAYDENKPMNNPEVKAFGKLWDTWWVPIDDNTYLHYAINITERKQLEEALRKSHDELERRVEERTEEVTVANELLRREIAIRKRSEEALRETQERYKDLWDGAPVAYHTLDTKGIITRVNQTEADMFGYTKEEMVGKPIFAFIAPEQRKDAEERFYRKLSGQRVPKHDNRIYVKKDGTMINVSIDDAFDYDGNGKVVSVRTTMVDVTEQKRVDEALRRVNRALQVLSDCNEAVIRATDELEFIKEVCRIVVEDGGYRLAWAGFAEQDDAKTVRPVAQWGYEEGYLKTLDVTWADTERGRGPTGKAIRTMKPSTAREIMTDPDFAPWRAAATKRGYASSIALPLITEGRSLGALNIYAKEPDAFDTEEVDLLSNLADDLSYGIVSLRARAELQRVSSQLLEVQENERKRISRELHDSIGQSLAAVKFGIENALDKVRQGTTKVQVEPLEALIPVVQQASEEVRKIHTDLRPSLLDDLGILSTISWFCREFETVYSGIRIDKQISIEEEDVSEPLKIVVFRILQEALNNVAKHSNANVVRVALRRTDDQIDFVIEDNGQGFEDEGGRSVKVANGGFGITSMRERVEISGGSFSIEPSKGLGTTVRASWQC